MVCTLKKTLEINFGDTNNDPSALWRSNEILSSPNPWSSVGTVRGQPILWETAPDFTNLVEDKQLGRFWMSQASSTILWSLNMKYTTGAHSCIYASRHQGAERPRTQNTPDKLTVPALHVINTLGWNRNCFRHCFGISPYINKATNGSHEHCRDQHMSN